jgi:hypothetical protein
MLGNLILGFSLELPVVQTAFFLTEFLIISMKIHSYIMTNREYDKEYSEKSQDTPVGKVEKKEGKIFLRKI